MQTTTATETVTPATRDDVIKLKEDWLRDPCFDLDGIPGFEAFADELRTFQAEHEQRWAAERAAELHAFAQRIGCPGNLELARYVENLQSQLTSLRERIVQLEDRAC